MVPSSLLRWFLIATLLLPVAAKAQMTAQAWIEDIDTLARDLPDKHINFFHAYPRETFEADIAALKDRVADMQPYEIEMALSRILAKVKDGHTGIVPNVESSHYLPVQFTAFKDGLFVTRAAPEYRNLYGGKVTKLGNLTLKTASNRLRKFVSHDNSSRLRYLLPRLFGQSESLATISAWRTPQVGTVDIQKAGKSSSHELTAMAYEDAKGVQWVTRNATPPLYARKANLDHWNDWIAAEKTLYFKYNRCQNPVAFNQLVNGTAGFVQQNDVRKFILDLRENNGGDSSIFRPLLKYLTNHKFLNHKDRLFVVIGPATYSSAMMNAIEMKTSTKATFIGQPTGGKPNHFGEVRTLQLPNSKLTATYSTKHFKTIEKGDPAAVAPDHLIHPTFEEWSEGIDPVVDFILSVGS